MRLSISLIALSALIMVAALGALIPGRHLWIVLVAVVSMVFFGALPVLFGIWTRRAAAGPAPERIIIHAAPRPETPPPPEGTAATANAPEQPVRHGSV